jgi:uncharacterized membrane protein
MVGINFGESPESSTEAIVLLLLIVLTALVLWIVYRVRKR